MTKFETNFINIFSCDPYTVNVQKVGLSSKTPNTSFKMMRTIREKAADMKEVPVYTI